MLALFKKHHNLKMVALAALFSVAALSANAQISEDVDTSDLSNGFDSLPSLNLGGPVGYQNEFDYTYNHDSDGVSLNAGYRSNYRYDWGKYVNTSTKKVTLVNVNAGIQSDMKLGCKGIEGGLEALFEFDAGDILEYLPQYILTNLAVEALAQIYATPLISTVMDGLKAMQNWVAEMKQASCDMSKVMDRSEEIRAGRVQDCIKENMPENGKVTSAIMSDCEDPGKLAQMIKDAKEYAGTKSSSTDSVYTILGLPSDSDDYQMQKFRNSNNEPLTTAESQRVYEANKQGDDEAVFSLLGARYTKGKLTSMFLPNVTFKLNGGAKEEEPARLNAAKTYDKAKKYAYNAVFGIYSDIIDSFDRKGLLKSKDRTHANYNIDEYLDKLMSYGNRTVFTDQDTLNSEIYDSNKISDIEEDFDLYHSYIFSSSNTKTTRDEFLIGPKKGPENSDEISSSDTDFRGDARKYLLQAGNNCFAKVNTKKIDSRQYYTWTRLDLSSDALFSKLNLDENQTVSDAIIENASVCNALKQLNITTMNMMMNKGKYYGKAYIENIAARAAFNTATIITNAVIDQLSSSIKDDESTLIEECQSVGVGNLKRNAVYDGQKNQAYRTCEDYSRQNKMSPEKKAMIEMDIESFKDKLKVLEENKKQAEKDYEMVYQLMISDKNSYRGR